jgi:hypothetical protein
MVFDECDGVHGTGVDEGAGEEGGEVGFFGAGGGAETVDEFDVHEGEWAVDAVEVGCHGGDIVSPIFTFSSENLTQY